MFTFTKGSITNPVTNATADIVVKALNSKSIRDLIIGGAMSILGMVYLAYSSIRNGADAMNEAELNAMYEVGVIDEETVSDTVRN